MEEEADGEDADGLHALDEEEVEHDSKRVVVLVLLVGDVDYQAH